MTGQVLGAGLGGGAMLAGTLVFKGSALTSLNKQLASEAQMADVAAGQGKVTVALVPLRSCEMPHALLPSMAVALQIGRKLLVGPTKPRTERRSRFTYQHIPTGKVVEFKSKVQ